MSEVHGFEIRNATGPPPQPSEGKVFAWVRITFEYPIEVDPGYLELTEDADYDEPPTRGTWHRSEGTWCADNFLDEIEAATEMERKTGRFASINGAMHNGCLGDFVEHPVTVSAEPSRGQRL